MLENSVSLIYHQIFRALRVISPSGLIRTLLLLYCGYVNATAIQLVDGRAVERLGVCVWRFVYEYTFFLALIVTLL